jgi:hypothetical protein
MILIYIMEGAGMDGKRNSACRTCGSALYPHLTPIATSASTALNNNALANFPPTGKNTVFPYS